MPYQYVEGEPPQAQPAKTPTPPPETAQQIYERNYGQQQQQATPPQAPPPPPQVVRAEIPEELTETIRSLAQEVQTIKSKVAPPPAPADPEEWVEKIRAGDFKAARQSLLNEFKKEFASDIQTKSSEAEQRALQAMQTQMRIDEYVREVRSANPDIAPYERYLKPQVEAAVAADVQSGRIKTVDQYVSAYRKAVDTEVETLRNLRLQERAGGKQEAMTRTKQVLSSTPLAPNQTSNRTTEAEQGEIADVSSEAARMDYITRRNQALNRSRGLA